MSPETASTCADSAWLRHAEAVPEFRVADTIEEFERQRAEIRATLWKLLGRLPPRPSPIHARILSVEETDVARIERFELENGAGDTVPGVIFLPRNLSGPAPAILWNHSHGDRYESGCRELFEADPTPVAPGSALAALGYVVLSIDACCFGDRQGRGPGGPHETGAAAELTAAKLHLWLGRTLWGMMLRDDLLALDYLAARPEVDPARIGAAGMSMGATRTWWLLALDDRPKMGAAVCCLTRYQDLIAAQQLHGHGIYYYVPGVLNHFDTEAIIACIAPRPFLSIAGELDSASPVSGIHGIEKAATPAWQLYGQKEAFRSLIHAGVAHTFTPSMWSEMIEWFQRHL
jgi:dienelactone hydrolase